MRLDITNIRFGKLVAVSCTGTIKGGYRTWLCKCDCGKTKIIRAHSLLSGNTKSCGCNKGWVKHHMSYTPLHKLWRAMKRRCYNHNDIGYKNYGGREIKVCDRWLNSFENFYADMGVPKEGMSLDRIDNDKGYCPENCKWSSRTEQNRNTRRSVFKKEDFLTETQIYNILHPR